MIKSYNNEDDQKFKNVISSLRGLPRIAAPEDFEADLKRRINLLESSPEKMKKKSPERWSVFASLPLAKILYPAAIMITAVLLFFLLPINTADDQQNQIARRAADSQQVIKEDPGAAARRTEILKEHSASRELTAEKPSGSSRLLPETGLQASPGRAAAAEKDNKAEFASSEQLKKRIREFRFMGRENDVDQSLQAKPQTYGSGYQDGTQNVNFQGFDIIRDENPVLDEILRSRMDSMRRSQQREK
ncbi:MAG: hypothetical protein ACM3SM_02225 [Bacteroidota bacterium]